DPEARPLYRPDRSLTDIHAASTSPCAVRGSWATRRQEPPSFRAGRATADTLPGRAGTRLSASIRPGPLPEVPATQTAGSSDHLARVAARRLRRAALVLQALLLSTLPSSLLRSHPVR